MIQRIDKSRITPVWQTAGSDTVDTGTWRLRASGALVALAACWYIPWLLNSTNLRAWWLSIPFVVASLALVATALLSWVNNWQRTVAPALAVADGEEPLVGVIIPTAGEAVTMVERTLQSVLDQDWPQDKLCLAVGDDSRRPEVAEMVARVACRHPAAQIFVYHPPARGDAARRGEAKSGNLNAGLAAMDRRGVDTLLIETRDADDEVGDPRFLRRCVSHLLTDSRVAFVQSIKEAAVSREDPFGNLEPMFYRGAMAARNAANSVFPCGSGLVWSRVALTDIGGFPAWNLVEDLQSGVEALRRGWHGIFVPVVGAVGQTAPEDMPNMLKQRGTWALDTVRLLFWSSLDGMTLRQRLHFLELAAFYFQGVATMVFFCAPAIGLLTGVYPLVSSSAAYTVHFWPLTISVELFLLALNANGRWELIFRARQMWAGLAPVFTISIIRALTYGPRRKPTYKVTRKTHIYQWYWREALPQLFLIMLMASACVSALTSRSLLIGVDIGSLYWCVIGLIFLTSFLTKSWFGVREIRAEPKRSHRSTAESASPRLQRRPLWPPATDAGAQPTTAPPSNTTTGSTSALILHHIPSLGTSTTSRPRLRSGSCGVSSNDTAMKDSNQAVADGCPTLTWEDYPSNDGVS